MQRLQAAFTVSASMRVLLRERSAACGLGSPVPAILWAREIGQRDAMLSLAFYERAQLPVWEPIYLVEVDDALDIAFLQRELLEDLDGAELTVADGRLAIVR